MRRNTGPRDEWIMVAYEQILASGTIPSRLRDLADVQDLIRHLKLPRELAEELDPSVREKYVELWTDVQNAPDGE